MSIEKINQAKAEISATSAYKTITAFFDADSFCEIDAFAKSGEGFAEVVAGFGTVEGMPVYAFAQNSDICGGAMSKAQAAKLKKLYDLALKTGAPVVGFYDSVGGRLNQGTELLAGCGDVLNAAASLSGVVPQISVVLGTCLGTNALNAASADIVIMSKDAQLSLSVTMLKTVLPQSFVTMQTRQSRLQRNLSFIFHQITSQWLLSHLKRLLQRTVAVV